MAEYKTIAGPIGLMANSGQDYENAVKKYAAIIDENTVGGWELLWIQQIPVSKHKTNSSGVLGVAVIVAVIGAAIGVALEGMGGIFGGLIIGGIIGAAIGAVVSQDKVVEFFNMLVFVKKN